MKLVPLVALRTLTLQGRTIAVGEGFLAHGSDAVLLIAQRQATLGRHYRSSAMQAATPLPPPAPDTSPVEEPPVRRRRRYRRRDLTVEP